MSVESLANSVATVHRLTETTGALRAQVNAFTPQTGPVRLWLAPPAETRDDEGAGEERRGGWIARLSAGANVQERDVLEVTSGPYAPINLSVLVASTPSRGGSPVGHHLKLSLERYTGVLT